jgi:type I restriction enzyme S subunit
MKIQKALHRIRPKSEIDNYYLFYWFQLASKTGFLEPYFTGTTIKHLTGKALAALEVPLPPIRVQRSMVDALKQLDDRITLLREANASLEAIAQALFKSWFVDFDPVRAKMEGRAPEGMDETTAALFPDGFEESELGLVPRGWRVGCLEDICSTMTNGGTPSRSKKEFWDGGTIPWFKTGEFQDGFLLRASELITNAALSGSSVKLLPKHSVLMAIYAAPTVGRLGVLTEPATFNQACTGMVAKAEVGPWFLYWTLFNGRDWFNSRANGAAQQNISKTIVSSYRIVIPTSPALAAFNHVVAVLHESVSMNSEKAMTLSTLRDTLLPRLISGQLRLPEALEEATQ